MKVTRGAAIVRSWCWPLAVAVAVALAPAAASAHDKSAAALQPEQIRMVQRSLQERGYTQVQPTGAWDDPTRSALSDFQDSKGLPRTGRLDPATSQALGVNLEAVRPVSGTANNMASWSTRTRDLVNNCETNNTVDCSPGGG